MSKRLRIVLILLILAGTLGLDQMTKMLAKKHLPRYHALSYAGDTVRLDYVENRGAVFNFEGYLPSGIQGDPLTAGVLVLLAVLLLVLLFSPVLPLLWVVSLSLLCGGALGNLLDRISPANTVVDFLSLGWMHFRTPIFNVADAAVTTGLVLLGLGVSKRLLGRVPGK